MKETVTAGGVVVNPSGQVLVVNQRGNSWSLPKGHLDPGENALTAARREIYEESGVHQLELVKPLGHYVRHRISLTGGDDFSERKTIHMFFFRTTQTDLKPVDPDNPEARWVAPAEVSAMLTHQKDREFFERIRPEIC